MTVETLTDLLGVAVDVKFEHIESIVFPMTVVVEPYAARDTNDVDLHATRLVYIEQPR